MSSACGFSAKGALLLFLICLNVPAQDLKVILLGTGSPIPIINRFGPSTLIEAGGQKLLIDCGCGASLRLWQLHVPLGDVTAVLLTHLHSDHIVGIPDLWLTGWLPPPFGHRTGPFRVWGPVGTRDMMANLEKAYQSDIKFRMVDGIPPQGVTVVAQDLSEGVIYEKEGVRVTAFQVDHATAKPAFGYRIDYGNRSVVLSGDTRLSENLIRFSKGSDVLIHEVAWARPDLLSKSEAARTIIGLHTTPEEAGTVFARVKPRLAVYSHIVLVTTDPAFSVPTSTDVLRLTRKTYSGPLELGEDLTTIEIGNKINVHRFAGTSQ
ncbi:MAG: MBL fold metallo-hydrolase [Acidobacteriota bacterium]|nr:MBL fold metallo-hydrolase [Acidobacteriota bacterium]